MSAIDEYKEARSLDDLCSITGEDDPEQAYEQAKEDWSDASDELASASDYDGLPGDRVDIDGATVYVHGVTHEGTAAETHFHADELTAMLEDGDKIFLEQGLENVLFKDHLLKEDDTLVDQYPLLHKHLAGGAGDIRIEKMDDLTRIDETVFDTDDHESNLQANETDATEELREAASKDPRKLREFQNHYRATFLPVEVERDYLQDTNPPTDELTHGRSENMVDYAMEHTYAGETVHIIAGAKHHPGILDYLHREKDGER